MISFSKLLELHSELDRAFAAHQYALLRFDFDLALKRLREYESALIAHMSDEETLLLPLYADRASIERGGAVKLFLGEHERMREWVKLFASTTERLKSDPDPEPLMIKLLDRESFYKKLCTHHDIRESKYLFPALDSITTEDERTAIFKQFAGPSVLASSSHRNLKKVGTLAMRMRP